MRNVSAFQPNGLKQIQLADTSLFSDANLISYYKLEDANDNKGSNNLTATSVTFGAGKFNNGAVFNAATDKLEIADNASLSITGALTVSCWAKINTKPADTKYVVFGRKWTTTGNQRSYGFYLYNAAGTYTVYSEVSVNGTTGTTGSYTYTPDSNWHLYTMVYTPSTSIVTYIDGVAVNTYTTSIPAAIYDSTSVFNLGSDGNGSVDTIIDDASVFNKALTAAEISQLYYAGSTKAYYPLNGNSRDFSGNTNTGTDTAITYPQGKFGQGARFVAASSSKIAMADSSSLSITGDFTFSFWLSIASNPAGSAEYNLITKYLTTGNQRAYQILYSENTGNYDIGLTVNADGASASTAVAWASVNFRLNRFYHVVIKYSASAHTSELYVNGLSQGTKDSVRTSIFDSTADLVLGSTAAGGSYLNGMMDELIMENRVWTAAEVSTYYRKSNLNYTQKTLAQMVFTYTSELLKGTYALTGKNLSTFRNYVSSLLKGAYTLTGKQLTATRGYVSQLLKGAYTLVGKALRVPFSWSNQSKTSTTWTNSDKTSSTWTNADKS